MTEECWVVTFPSTHHALRAEMVAKKRGIPAKMIPVPREISSDCNMGMKVSIQEADPLRAALENARVECDFVKWERG